MLERRYGSRASGKRVMIENLMKQLYQKIAPEERSYSKF